MIRTIHSIGQGGFYTERFENNDDVYNIVYDCGSDTRFTGKGKLIDHEITQTFKKDEIVNILFISHFHRDHINGIKKFLTYCKVEYIFLPIIDDVSRVLLLSSDDNKDFRDFIVNPVEYIKKLDEETNVVFVKSDNDGLEIHYDLQQEDRKYEIVESGENVAEKFMKVVEWEYKPFNLVDKELINKVKKAYEDAEAEIPKAIDANHIKLAKTILNKIIKSNEERNASSMILYSGAYDLSKWVVEDMFCNGQMCSRYCCGCCECLRFEYGFKSGCMYFGDYNLKKYKKIGIESKVSLMQVPHHGSIYNFNTDIFKYFEQLNFLFISAGEKNRYRHPSGNVIKDIIKSQKCFKLVTENKSSMLQFIYRKI